MRQKKPSLLYFLDKKNFTHNMWGGKWIAKLKGMHLPASHKIGESWEFSSHPKHPNTPSAFRNAPFLIKFIDANDDLSVQVHPSDAHAKKNERESGKAESWIILDVDSKKGGYIYLGFKQSSPAATLKKRFLSAIEQANQLGPTEKKSIQQKAIHLVLPFLNRIKVKPGEVYDVPPGTVHAIGRGVRLFEIQQSSDLTYRVWDWNRLDAAKKKKGMRVFRPLHIKKAFAVLNFSPKGVTHYKVKPLRVAGGFQLIRNRNKKFAVNELVLLGKNSKQEIKSNQRFFVLTGIEGTVSLFAKPNNSSFFHYQGSLSAGETCLVPAHTYSVTLTGSKARVFKSFLS